MTDRQSANRQASRETLGRQLRAGAEQLGVSLSEQQSSQLLVYLQLLHKWNAAYNLSAVRDIGQMVSRHLLDSLSIAPHIHGGDRWLDVGSGAGLPGIPLAILFPDKAITLLDSNGKKTRFLFQVKTELQLQAVSVEQSRVEAYRPARPFDAVFSRAFARLEDFLTGCAHLVAPGGYCYAMKGVYPEEELREVQKPFNVQHCHPLHVPGDTAARHLVVIQKLP